MPYSRTSPILTASRVSLQVDRVVEFAAERGASRLADLRQYLQTVDEACKLLRIDPVVIVAQSDLETDSWRSTWWNERLNPAGIGITGDPAQNAASQTWVDGRISAFGHLSHMAAYLWGNEAFGKWQPNWPDLETANRRFRAPIQAGFRAEILQDLNGSWAIDPQNNYGGKLAERANRMEAFSSSTPIDDSVDGPVRFGRVPHPPFERAIVPKPAHTSSGSGYDWVPSGRRIVGMVHHEWMGVGTESFHKGFFACPNGERCKNALVDYIIMKNGKIIMINEPIGNRSPWASGGGVGSPGGLEGDGPAFVAKFGVPAINARNVSIEYVKHDSERFTQEQVQAGGALAAYWHDQDGQLWNEHPFTSKHRLVTSFLHFEFGTTTCGKGELSDITRVQAVTKGIMRQHQQSGSGGPIEPHVPTQPSPTLPGGLTLAEARNRFGTLKRHNQDGSKENFSFDPSGIISLAWAHRSAAEDDWPRSKNWYVLDNDGDSLQIVTFANDWHLVQASQRSGFSWIDFVPSA